MRAESIVRGSIVGTRERPRLRGRGKGESRDIREPIESINEMFRRLTSGAVNGLPRKQAVEILSIGPQL